MPIAHPPQGLIDAVAKEPELRPEWNLDFASALRSILRLNTACAGIHTTYAKCC